MGNWCFTHPLPHEFLIILHQMPWGLSGTCVREKQAPQASNASLPMLCCSPADAADCAALHAMLSCVLAHQYGVLASEFQPTSSTAWLITAFAEVGTPAGSGQLLAGNTPPE